MKQPIVKSTVRSRSSARISAVEARCGAGVIARSATAIVAIGLAMASSLTSCKSTPDGVIPPDEMAELIADIFIGESVVENNSRAFHTDSTKRALRQSIYTRHGVDVATVDSSFMWYGKNMEKYTEVYDKAIEILEHRLENATLASDNVTTQVAVALEGDSVDVWPTVRYYRFGEGMPAESLPFFLSSDRYWERGDAYTLSVKMLGAREPATLTLAAEYYDGTTDYATTSLSGSGWRKLTLSLDSSRTASNIFGSITYKSADGGNDFAIADSITLYRTRWQTPQSAEIRRGQKSVKIR